MRAVTVAIDASHAHSSPQLRVLVVYRAACAAVWSQALPGCTVLHFTGHGSLRHLVFEDACGVSLSRPSDLLAQMLRVSRARVPLVVLSACHSLSCAMDLLSADVGAVVCVRAEQVCGRALQSSLDTCAASDAVVSAPDPWSRRRCSLVLSVDSHVVAVPSCHAWWLGSGLTRDDAD